MLGYYFLQSRDDFNSVEQQPLQSDGWSNEDYPDWKASRKQVEITYLFHSLPTTENVTHVKKVSEH